MGFPSIQFPRLKMLLHAVQAFVVFLGWALTIAVFTQEGANDGRTAYYFALCWFTVPALVYLAAVPMWPRTRRFGNAYAFAVLDTLFIVLWFAAWVAVASYVAAGKAVGAKDKEDDKNKNKDENKDKKGCEAFGFGSAAKCSLSTGTTILGVVIFLLFIATAYMSITNLLEYRRSGTMPYEGSDPTFAAQSKAAFSSNPAHDFDEDDDHNAEFRSGRPQTIGDDRERSPPPLGYRRDPDDEYALLHNQEADDLGGPHGNAPPPSYDPTLGNHHSPSPAPGAAAVNNYLNDYDTSYGGYGGGGHRSQASGSYHDGYGGR
ncbi:hypothetical protein AJ79_08962 [Helicocarpus griseus UAMH5409]|uniref:MARVEL domain-containing protein n=1 Tax=Helicocarpus griseus UAMH5409 TaxID=1447875 RepID=A0A2B7WNL7_9EURO|nr:hypothetical protein AJ79_08962 [Helicocarpus griseus UAMH5409]